MTFLLKSNFGVFVLAVLVEQVLSRASSLSWKNIREPLCRGCKCYNARRPLPLRPLKGQIEVPHRPILASKMFITAVLMALGNEEGFPTYAEYISYLKRFNTVVKYDRRGATVYYEDGTASIKRHCKIRNNEFIRPYKAYEGGVTASTKKDLVDKYIQEWKGTWHSKIVWADSKSHITVYCFPGHRRDSAWAYYSQNAKITAEKERKVLKIVRSMGFSLKSMSTQNVKTFLN